MTRPRGWSFAGTAVPGGQPMAWWCSGGVVRAEPVAGAQALPGRYALAGLVDAHCHLTMALGRRGPRKAGRRARDQRFAGYRRDGVLVVRDTGGVDGLALELAVADPDRVLACGRFLSTPGRYFPEVYEAVEPEGLVAAALAEVDAGAHWVKVVADFPDLNDRSLPPEPTFAPEVLAALVEAVHARGARVAAHTTTGYVGEVVRAGVDSVEHGVAMDEGTLDAMVDAGCAWTPTLSAVLGVPVVDPDVAGGVGWPAPSELVDRWSQLLPAAVERGLTVLTGSDVVGSVAAEVAWLARLGVAPDAALAAATTSARAYLRLPAPGPEQRADLVTYHDDPRDDPRVLATPAAVVSRGVRIR